MKKPLLLTLSAIITLLMLQSCSRSPEDVLTSFIEDVKTGNFENISNKIYSYDCEIGDDDGKVFSDLFQTIYKDSLNISSYSIENCNDTDDSVNVRNYEICLELSGGIKQCMPITMKKDNRNEWKILLSDVDSINPLANALYYAGVDMLSKRDIPEAQYKLAKLYKRGKYVDQNNTRYIELLKKAAKTFGKAQYLLGMELMEGKIIAADQSKAVDLYQKARDNGCKEVLSDLAVAYFNGTGVEKDFDKGLECLEEGINSEMYNCCNILGQVYKKGLGVAIDYNKAFDYYTMGVDHGFTYNKTGLAELYLNGLGVKQDYKKAVELYSEARKDGDEEAICGLAECYYKGLGVPKDKYKAVSLLSECSETNSQAKTLLDEINYEITQERQAAEYAARMRAYQQQYRPKRKVTCMWCQGQGIIQYSDFTVDGYRKTVRRRCSQCYGLGYVEE